MEKVNIESLVVLEDVNDDSREKKNCSFLQAVANMIGMLIGLAQLSTPYALQKVGWMSAFLLVGLGITCSYTSHPLGKCLEKNTTKSKGTYPVREEINLNMDDLKVSPIVGTHSDHLVHLVKDYKDIGQLAYGSKGRILSSIFIYAQIFMSLVSFTISLHDNLSTIFLNTNLKTLSSLTNLTTPQILTILAVLIALPSIWLRNLSSISFLSVIGISMSVLVFLLVTFTAIFGDVKVDHKIPKLQIQNIPAISGLYVFGYSGHIVFPNLYTTMRDPSKFTKVSVISFTLVTIHYTSLGIMGAKLFGPEVSSQVTLSMPRNLIFTKIALWATVLTPMSKYALEFAPFAIQLEQNILPKQMKDTTKMIIRGTIGSISLLVILVLALVVPYFDHVLSLTGSLVTMGVSIVFPSSFYMKIFWNQISRVELIMNVILIVIGIVLGISGTISSSKMLVANIRKGY